MILLAGLLLGIILFCIIVGIIEYFYNEIDK